MHHRPFAPLGVAILCSVASAQVTPTTGVARYEAHNNVGSYVELPGGEVNPQSAASGGSMRFTLTGDVRLNLVPGEHEFDWRELSIGGVQQFTVGMFPTLITPTIDAHFKVVNAGGPANGNAPMTQAGASLQVYTTGSYVHGSSDTSGLGERVMDVALGTLIRGNGYAIVDEFVQADEGYVLLPGESYTAFWRLEISSSVVELDGRPPAAIYYEAGGITDFDGFVFDLNAVVVPAPGAAALPLVAAALAVRRRRV